MTTTQEKNDAEVRALFVQLITFIATSKSSHAEKNKALDAVTALQARLLP